MQKITSREELIEYIIANKNGAGLLSEFTEEEIRNWADGRETAFVQSIAADIWKDGMDMLGVIR